MIEIHYIYPWFSLKNETDEVEKFVSANTQELGKDKWLCPLSGKNWSSFSFSISSLSVLFFFLAFSLCLLKNSYGGGLRPLHLCTLFRFVCLLTLYFSLYVVLWIFLFFNTWRIFVGKKFKGPDFVQKHIYNKHGEKVDEVCKMYIVFTVYMYVYV